MSLTPTAAWLAAFARATVRPRFLISIYDGVTTTGTDPDGDAWTWRCTTGSMDSTSDLYGVVEGARSVANIATEVDPLTRKFQQDECFVDFDDAYLRPIHVANVLRSKKLMVHLGAAELNETDFIDYFAGPIERIVPRDDGVIGAVVLSVFGQLERAIISGYFLNKHPFQYLYAGDGSGILEKGGATSFNTASFEPDNYVDDIGHIKGGRGGTSSAAKSAISTGGMYVIKDAPALPVAEYLLHMVNAFLTTDSAGALKISRFDSTDSAVDDWDEDDIIAGSFKQVEVDNLVNRVICKFGDSPDGFTETYEANETASQTTYAYSGGAATRIVTHEMHTDWLNGVSTLYADVAAGAGSLISFGNNENFAGNSSDAHAAISATQPAYLLLDSMHIPGKGYKEIVKATGLTRSTVDDGIVHLIDPVTGSPTNVGPYCNKLTYTTVTQFPAGGAGPANNHGGSGSGGWTLVYDVTPLVILADEILARFAQGGCPIVEVSTLLTKFPRSVGELVTLTWPRYVDYGHDGMTSSYKWQIIRREPNIQEGRIDWTLAYAGTNAITRTAGGWGVFGTTKYTWGSAAEEVLEQPYVGSGLVVSDAGGLDISISAGEVRGHGSVQKLLSAYPKTLTASKDTHICMHLNSGALLFHVVNVGAGYTPSAFETFIAKVTTDAADIVSISTTGKETLPVEGSKLKAGTGPLTCLAQTTGYLDNLQHVTTRSFDDVQDGTYFKRLYGVTANGMLAADEDRGGNLIPNSTFSAWESVNQMPVGWTVGNGTPGTDVLLDDTTANEIGDLVLQFDATTPANNPYLISADYIAVERGAPYRLSGLVQVDDITDANVYLYVNWYQKNKTYISAGTVLASEASVASRWLELSSVLVAPTNAQFAKVVIGKENTAFHCYFDWVKLERAPRGFHAYRSSNQSKYTTKPSAYDRVDYDTATYCNGYYRNPTTGAYDAWFDTATGLATVPKTGEYRISACAQVSPDNAADDCTIAIFIDGTRTYDGNTVEYDGTTAVRVVVSHSGIYLTKGQTVGIYCNSVASDFTIQGSATTTWFSMREDF